MPTTISADSPSSARGTAAMWARKMHASGVRSLDGLATAMSAGSVATRRNAGHGQGAPRLRSSPVPWHELDACCSEEHLEFSFMDELFWLVTAPGMKPASRGKGKPAIQIIFPEDSSSLVAHRYVAISSMQLWSMELRGTAVVAAAEPTYPSAPLQPDPFR